MVWPGFWRGLGQFWERLARVIGRQKNEHPRQLQQKPLFGGKLFRKVLKNVLGKFSGSFGKYRTLERHSDILSLAVGTYRNGNSPGLWPRGVLDNKYLCFWVNPP